LKKKRIEKRKKDEKQEINYSILNLSGKKRPHNLDDKLSEKMLVQYVNPVKTDR